MELKVTGRSPSPINFIAKQKTTFDPLKGLIKEILKGSDHQSSMEGRIAKALTSQESSVLGRLFRPLKTFIKESLNLPLSQDELANKIKEFALSPACKALGGSSLNTEQIYSLAMAILSQESAKAPSLRNRADVGGKSLGLF